MLAYRPSERHTTPFSCARSLRGTYVAEIDDVNLIPKRSQLAARIQGDRLRPVLAHHAGAADEASRFDLVYHLLDRRIKFVPVQVSQPRRNVQQLQLALLLQEGDDAAVRVYDANEMREERVFSRADGFGSIGHSDPIYSIKWHSSSLHILFSAGWDQTVQMWDVRKKNPRASVFGAYVCGDALDVTSDGLLLTGSWRSQRSLQLWDIRREGPVKDYSFQQEGEGPAMLYAARALTSGELISAMQDGMPLTGPRPTRADADAAVAAPPAHFLSLGWSFSSDASSGAPRS